MALKDTLDKLNNINLSEIDLSDLDINSAGLWPTPIKVITALGVFVLILALGYFFLVTDLQQDLAKAGEEEKSLKTSYREKYAQASNLEGYRLQAKEMEANFQKILSQLPLDTEIPGLIEDISTVGSNNGLVFNKIDLQPEQVLEYYVEKPIRMEVVGGYHDLGAFVSFQNRMDFGASYRTNAALSLMIYVNVVNGIDIGYAYETPTDVSLAGQSIKTHEIFFRIRLGEGTQTVEKETSTGGPMNQ